ncbi:MAG: GT4 family glycosyltransferase PelF [Candidatus Riflebacteria bacterium]|nr:GT4 family glycosyltransferase PelF [Candidatus Riflebacteria bacterium]
MTADVCFVLEGSYPYVRGGVSSWTHQLIRGMPELKFSLLTVVASRKDLKLAYELPGNVVEVEDVVLSYPDAGMDRPTRVPDGFIARIERLHRALGNDETAARRLAMEFLGDATCAGPRNDTAIQALSSSEAWDLMLRIYQERGHGGSSFNAYFYTYLQSHFRFFRSLRARVPDARLYHAASTGYAGIAAVSASLRTRRPLLLTEHGIYVNERNMDITMLDWLDGRPVFQGIDLSSAPSAIRGIWMRFFEFMGRLTYDQAALITTLFRGNLSMQVEYGADHRKLQIIPNGVDVARLGALPRNPDPARPRVCLIGRVVPIKDIRTFIKACALVERELPGASFEILGPYDEDPPYHESCRQLVKELGLERSFVFAGHVDLSREFSTITVAVLTSMSEGLPLVMLETMACGIPNVASRVGACEEIVMGGGQDDRKLGPAGIVTGVAAPEETARGIVRILTDPRLYEEMARACRERVQRYYDQTQVLNQYRDIYRRLSAQPDSPRST